MIEKFKNFTALYDENEPLKIDIVGETYCDKTFKIERNNSDLNAFEFIIDGKGTLEIDDQYLTVEKSDVFFLKKGSSHKYQSDSKEPWHKFWIVFNGDFAESLINCYLPKDVYLFKGCDAVKRYFEEIVETTRKDMPYDVMVNRITISLMHIFIYIRNRVLMENEDLPDIIRKKLDESIESPFNLDNLCKGINYSKNYVIHVFKNKYNLTPYQYFLDKKIDAAKTYLTHTNLSVGSIANTLHYADQQYFSSSFKKATGYSPLEYRRKTRKD
ncbi:MAG: AraC family transcriptional regulator [Clostridiales bacterium]|nr:AraC family transcriptional regulator [Clostridiales bacterium]